MPAASRSEVFREKVRQLPDGPGVYLMKDRLGRIIYVGKAKSLKKRVSTYFQAGRGRALRHQPKIRTLIEMIADFEALLARFVEINQRFLFVRRAERSTQSHLKEAIWDFEHDCHANGRVPETHEDCAVIDARINQMLRSTKARRDYFIPEEEMLCAWLRTYGGLTSAGEATVRARWREDYRRRGRSPESEGSTKA